MLGGKGGKKRKGGGITIPQVSASGLHMPSPTLSVSGSVARRGLAGAVSRYDAVKILRLGVAQSVGYKAIAELVEGVTGMSCDPPMLALADLFALPSPMDSLLDRGEKKAKWLGGRVESELLDLDSALLRMFKWC